MYKTYTKITNIKGSDPKLEKKKHINSAYTSKLIHLNNKENL